MSLAWGSRELLVFSKDATPVQTEKGIYERSEETKTFTLYKSKYLQLVAAIGFVPHQLGFPR